MNIINNTNTAAHVLAVSGLDSKFAGLIAQFLTTSCKDTGWNWQDAIEASLEAGGDIDFDSMPLGRFLSAPVRGVDGWSWRDAISESLDRGVDVQLSELPFGRFDGAPVLH